MADRGLGSVRARTTIAATAVVGVALLIASVAMLEFVERSLIAQVEDAAELDAMAVASDRREPSVPIPADPTEGFVQVLRDGRVIAASENVAGEPPLAMPAPGAFVRLDEASFADGPFVVTAVADRGDLIVVGRSADDATEARGAVASALGVGAPALLVLVAIVTWWITGRALRPVDEIRAEVDRITASELDRRVPEAPGDDEVAKLARTMNRMLGRLEHSSERQRRFVSDASHELRSPVAAIRQHAEVGREHPAATSVDDLAAAVFDETERLQVLVEDLLLLARLDEGAPLGTAEVDLDDIVLAEAARLRATTSIEIDTSGITPRRVAGDRAALERLVRNLTTNAGRFARSKISLALTGSNGGVSLSVEDDGPGIPEADRERVLDRFVRLDQGRSRGAGGAGLGLSIVGEVAAGHAGRVTLGSSRLGGLLVEVSLPGSR